MVAAPGTNGGAFEVELFGIPVSGQLLKGAFDPVTEEASGGTQHLVLLLRGFASLLEAVGRWWS